MTRRLRHMEELAVDVQMLYPTIFLSQWADGPEVAVAVCRGYSRWLADIWRPSGDVPRSECNGAYSAWPGCDDLMDWDASNL